MPEVHRLPSIPTNILVPIDFSPSSQAALEAACDLAQHFQAESVWSTSDAAVHFPYLPFPTTPSGGRWGRTLIAI